MNSGPNLPSSSPILALVLIIVMAAMLITSSKWLMVDIPADTKELDPESKKLIGRWEQTVGDRVIYMDLEENGECRYALREADRLNFHGNWKIEEDRLVLHIDKVNAGTTFRAGETMTLGPVTSVGSRTLTLGAGDDKTTFRRRR
jgi:hypothetical protein